MNTDIYQTVAVILQTAQAHNVTVPGGAKYNVPSGNITADLTMPTQPGAGPRSNLTSYSTAAIVGADDYKDSQVTIKDLFDIIVQNTREVTPTCMFPTVCS